VCKVQFAESAYLEWAFDVENLDFCERQTSPLRQIDVARSSAGHISTKSSDTESKTTAFDPPHQALYFYVPSTSG
jgi:hypothetical protein